MNWWLTAASLAAVLALAGIAWLLRLGGTQPLKTGEDAIRLAEAMCNGFEGRMGIVSANGELATAAGGTGDLVLIQPMGARHRADRYTGARVAMVDDGPGGSAITLQLSPQQMFRITIADAAAARAFADILGH